MSTQEDIPDYEKWTRMRSYVYEWQKLLTCHICEKN